MAHQSSYEPPSLKPHPHNLSSIPSTRPRTATSLKISALGTSLTDRIQAHPMPSGPSLSNLTPLTHPPTSSPLLQKGLSVPTLIENRPDEAPSAEDPCQLVHIALPSLPPPKEQGDVDLEPPVSLGRENVVAHSQSHCTHSFERCSSDLNLLVSPGHEDIRNWVPKAKSAHSIVASTGTQTEAQNLPDRSTIGAPFERQPQRLTAHPSTHIRQELEANLTRLLDRRVFVDLLKCAPARAEFRSWLVQNEPEGSGFRKLDRWTDEQRTEELTAGLKAQCEALFALYYHANSDGHVAESPKAVNEASIQTLASLSSGLDGLRLSRSQDWLTQSLYDSEFQRFVTSKLVDQTQLRLGRGLKATELSGLGDSFCICNPRLRDNPIVMVSPGFIAITGYERTEILGRNCRFLQGPRTSATSIGRIRQALRSGKPCVELLLNYRRDGSPFYCLLNIIPLFDENAAVTYFIGGQVNVSGDLESSQKLWSLLLQNPKTEGERMNGQSNFVAEESITDSPLMKNFKHGEPLEIFAPLEFAYAPILGHERTTAPSRRTIGLSESGKKSRLLADWLARLGLKRNQVVVKEAQEGIGLISGPLAGAADSFGKDPLPLEHQFDAFECTYSRVCSIKLIFSLSLSLFLL
ncbi:hypothetical protein CROQUDRAFT_662383 [Cronartium quercuum f. sp. fusiforme G11]|uniref:LOV domain-containing protein n=1 Tax=Cronartium quercuum f. sp. fusiforme G11 TaxID=708437 RepID=A0A9P6NEB6_9BASI|nr:hypothetical protein CROQUDRAFT_662383 [Cronartium quercuum f. sp. fusiforme G11]